ncbi:MAG: hypothetical protein AB7U75_11010 [Hyphomicrobiaceae bacterium]
MALPACGLPVLQALRLLHEQHFGKSTFKTVDYIVAPEVSVALLQPGRVVHGPEFH